MRSPTPIPGLGDPAAESEGAMMVVVPPFSRKHNLEPRNLTILQTVANNDVVTTFDYYRLGLSMGIPDQILTQNYNDPSRLEMLVCAKLINYQLSTEDFMCYFLHSRVWTNIREFYRNKHVIVPSEKDLNMNVWAIPISATRKETYFEYALFTFGACLAALDFTNYYSLYSEETNDLSPSMRLKKAERCHDLGDEDSDLIVNEFLFQIGIRMEEVREEGEKLFGDADAKTWDMQLVYYKLFRKVWLRMTEKETERKMHRFTRFFSDVIRNCPHSRILRSLLIFFIPKHLLDVDQDTMTWIRNSLLRNWREEGRKIIDMWGCENGFSVATVPHAEGDTEPAMKMRRAAQEALEDDYDPFSDYLVKFSADCDSFISNNLDTNKFFFEHDVDSLEKYELKT